MSTVVLSQTKKRSARDYQFGNTIGEGSYSTVYSAVDLHNNKTYAIKVLSKRHIVKEDKIKYVNIEKTTLHRLGLQHPGIVQLYYTFQDESSLFFVLDFAEYGELLSIIRKFGSLSEQVSLFYMIQLIDSVKFIHLKGIIHRDLKPENILVGIDFNLKITDFGAAKLLDITETTNTTINTDDEKIDYNSISKEIPQDNTERKASFVGTAEYVAPELLNHNSCGFESDIWALGCILYQFFNGSPPFKGQTEYLTFEKIINVEYGYKNSNPLPKDVVQIIDQILLADPSQRLTIPQIQTCSWFKNVPWNDPNYIWGRKVPRFEPYESTNINFSSNYSPASKTGSNRNMNKSNSQQQLHNQLHKSDFTLVPSISTKKSYQPATKLKKFPGPNMNAVKNYSPPKGLAIVNGPQLSVFHSPHPPTQAQMPQLQISPMAKPQVSPQSPHGSQMALVVQLNGSRAPQQRFIQSTPPNINPNSQQSGSYFDESKVQALPPNIRHNTAFANGNNFPNVSPKLSNSTSSSYFQQPSTIMLKPQNVNLNHASAAAAAVSNLSLRSNPRTVPKSSPNDKPQAKQEIKETVHKINFNEISGLLVANEKILKLDVILKLQLSSKLRPKNQILDDKSIEKLINKYEPKLAKDFKPEVTIITNMARVFFVDGLLNVMLIDLKANNGGDYLMYDYEFESVLETDEEVEDSEEVYGYLILELLREGGDLIFLKRIPADSKAIKDNVMVVDQSGSEVKLGIHYGWIDCLLIAKDMVAKAAQSPKPNQSAKPAPFKSTTSSSSAKTAKTTQSQTKKENTKKVRPKSNNHKEKSANIRDNKKNFAYAAAAAAHKT